jgi:hypothetical protein
MEQCQHLSMSLSTQNIPGDATNVSFNHFIVVFSAPFVNEFVLTNSNVSS